MEKWASENQLTRTERTHWYGSSPLLNTDKRIPHHVTQTSHPMRRRDDSTSCSANKYCFPNLTHPMRNSLDPSEIFMTGILLLVLERNSFFFSLSLSSPLKHYRPQTWLHFRYANATATKRQVVLYLYSVWTGKMDITYELRVRTVNVAVDGV